MKSIKTVNVKELQGTSYVISQSEFIGKGSFASVYRAYDTNNPSEQLIAKIIPLNQGLHLIESIKSQLEILKNLPYHQNLVNCKKLSITTDHNFYMIMEFCNGGSLQSLMKVNLDEKAIWNILKQICRGYLVLYDNKIIHRDIKPDNILIHNGKVKICDFGLSRRIQHTSITQKLSVKGTPIYAAPQLLYDHRGDSKVDIFSLGVLVYRLCFNGQYPFGMFNSTYQYLETLKELEVYIPNNHRYSNNLIQLLLRMMQKDPESRISWEEIFAHPKIALHEEGSQQQENKVVDQLKQLTTSFKKQLNIMKASKANVSKFAEPLYVRDLVKNENKKLMQFCTEISNQKQRQLEAFLFKGKIITLIIEHVNKKIINSLQFENYPEHLIANLTAIVQLGYKFGLKILIQMKERKQDYMHENLEILRKRNTETHSRSLLETINSNYLEFEKYYQDITGTKPQPLLIENAGQQYNAHLYHFLIEFKDYSETIQQKTRTIVSFLIDLYDISFKYPSIQQYQNQNTQIDKICETKQNKLKDYMFQKQNAKWEQIDHYLMKYGLLII